MVACCGVGFDQKKGSCYAAHLPLIEENNGLPVCAMRERVNRYTVHSWYILTASATYDKVFLNRKGCDRSRRS